MILKIVSIFVLSATGALDKVSRRNEASEGLQKLGWHLVRSTPADENMVSSDQTDVICGQKIFGHNFYYFMRNIRKFSGLFLAPYFF